MRPWRSRHDTGGCGRLPDRPVDSDGPAERLSRPTGCAERRGRNSASGTAGTGEAEYGPVASRSAILELLLRHVASALRDVGFVPPCVSTPSTVICTSLADVNRQRFPCAAIAMPVLRCEPPVPPKIRIPQSGSLAFMYVLSEFESLGLENEGLRLWQALRRVRDWHGAPPQEPDAATGTYADVDPALRPSLAALERLLGDTEPDDATLEAVAFCCYTAAMWADERGAYRTAVGLLHAAEDVYPDNPHYAYNLGRIARKLALYDESEAWLKWAHYVARSSGKWEVATLSLSGLGNLHRQRGNLPKARRFHEVTRRIARLKNLRTLEGDALYDLCVICLYARDEKQALKYARQAMVAYGPGHSHVYKLANDVAWFWMDSFGRFENAAYVFIALLDYIWDPPFRILLFGNLTRAAAGARWTAMFEQMWTQTYTLIRQQISRQGHAASLVQLALGAGTLGYWERAELAAQEALAVARQRKESEAVIVAEGILKAFEGNVIRDEQITETFKDRVRPPGSQPDEASSDLTALFANAMRARRDNAPESPTHALVNPFDQVSCRSPSTRVPHVRLLSLG